MNRFFAGQRDRMNGLIAKAETRLKAIEAGQGRFVDDEPFIQIDAAPGAELRRHRRRLPADQHHRQQRPVHRVEHDGQHRVRRPADKLAANYVEGPARPAPANLGDWPGARFYKPGATKWCTATATTIDCKTTP